jgi:hypothetical protein
LEKAARSPLGQPLAAYVPTNEFLQPLLEEEMNDE